MNQSFHSQQDKAKLSTGNCFSINQPVRQNILKKQTETSAEGRICTGCFILFLIIQVPMTPNTILEFQIIFFNFAFSSTVL